MNTKRLLDTFAALVAIDSPSLGERKLCDYLADKLLGGNSGNLYAYYDVFPRFLQRQRRVRQKRHLPNGDDVFKQLPRAKKFPIRCSYIAGGEVKISPDSAIVGALRQGAAVVIRLMYGCWPYVLLTGVRGDAVELFDPYYPATSKK